jgi:hypothetical protein
MTGWTIAALRLRPNAAESDVIGVAAAYPFYLSRNQRQ